MNVYSNTFYGTFMYNADVIVLYTFLYNSLGTFYRTHFYRYSKEL